MTSQRPVGHPFETHAGLSRRNALRLGVAGFSLASLAAGTAASATGQPNRSAPQTRSAGSVAGSVAELEERYGVRIGLFAQNLRTGDSIKHRQHDRFAMLSTFKTLAVAAVLRDRDRGGNDLRRQVRYDESDVVEYSPITSQRRRMSVAELCDAALRYSDNTAGNLLLRRIGGPAGLTRFARSIGDHETRLDRWEPELNSAIPGDPRDTSTPAALARSYRRLLLGRALPVEDQWLLRAWLQGNLTNATRLRAGVPASWTLADKTGGGAYASINDVGIAVAPDGTHLVIAVMTRSDDPAKVGDNAVIADVARLVVERLG